MILTIIIIMEDTTINISLSLNKDELVCCVCQESLTKQVYQCVNGNHYMCGQCEPKWTKCECPTCRHPARLVRNIFFEEQLKQHLKPCPNTGCCEKFFKWNTEHPCLFAPVKCRVCRRDVAGNIASYCSHLEGFCDDVFKSLQVPSFEKKLRYKPNLCSSVLKLPNKTLLVIKKTGHSYKLSSVKNSDTELTDYKNIICTYTRSGIEYTVTIPITNLNEVKMADIHFAEGEMPECVFIFSKDVQIKPPQSPQPNNTYGVRPTQYNLDQNRAFDSPFGFGSSSFSGYPSSTYLGSGSSTTYNNATEFDALLRLLENYRR